MKPDPTDWLVTPDLNKPEGWTYPIKHNIIAEIETVVADRLRTLKNIINNRTVAIMLHGASISEFAKRAKEFEDFNFCYLSLNRFNVMEEKILSKIDKSLDIVFCMSEQEIPRRLSIIHDFLDREENNAFMTTYSALSWGYDKDVEHILKHHGSKIYIMPRLLCRPIYPISLALILDQLILNNVKKVVLFGADGFLLPSGKVTWDQKMMLNTYFDPEFFINEKRASGLSFGTKHFNDTYCYNPSLITVVNCSENSFYRAFPKINYNKLKEMKAWI